MKKNKPKQVFETKTGREKRPKFHDENKIQDIGGTAKK